MPAALDVPRVARAARQPSPSLRRLLLRLVLAMQVPLVLAATGLLASYWDNRVDHAVETLHATTAALDASLRQRDAPGRTPPLEDVLARARLPAGWTAGFADRRGIVVAHSADRNRVGRPLPGGTAQAAAASRREWTAADGRRMVTSYAVSAPHGWTTFVTVPRAVLVAPAWQATGKLFAGVAVLVALGLWGALRFTGRIADALEALQQPALPLPGGRQAALPHLRFSEAEELGATLEASGRAVRQAHLAVQESERRLAAVLHTAGNAIIVTDSTPRILVFNEAAERAFGLSKAHVTGRPLEILFTPRSWQHFCGRCAESRAQPGVAGSAVHALAACLRAGDAPFPAELLVSDFVDAAGERFTTVILRDITQRLRSQQSLRAAHREVQRTNERFERTLLREMDGRMAELARELHDGVGSTLAGISLLAAGGRSCTGEPRLVKLLAQMQQQVQGAAERVRQISHGIMPAGSDAGALLPALEQFAQGFGAAADVRCSVRSRGCFDGIAPEVGAQVYRVVQEATANALRHGHATRIRIVLAQAGDRFRLAVTDNGSGCKPGQMATPHPGMGMRSMRARAAAIDGRLDLCSRPGAGCRLVLEWPMQRALS